MQNDISQLELVRLVKRLMAHRAVDVSRFAGDFEQLLRRSGITGDKFMPFVAQLDGFDETLTDLNCAIIDVLLAANAEEAKSIVDGFWNERQ